MNSKTGPTSASSVAASHQNTPQQNRMIRHMPSSVGVSSSSLTTNTTSTSAQPTELSAAITFLGEEALLQACDILAAQSEALFGTAVDTVKSENTSHVNKLTQLHEKVKISQEVIIKADESGTLNDTSNTQQQGIIMRSDSGLSKTNPSPSMNHRNSLVNVSGVKAPPNLSRGNSSISNTNTTPSLHRSRSSSLTAHGGGVGASGGKNQSSLLSGRRQKMPSNNNSTKQERTLNRLPSDTSDSGIGGDGGGKGSGKKAQPPPEVLNFLKALNSKNSGGPSGDGSGSNLGEGGAVGERLASFAGVDMPSSSAQPNNSAKKRPPPPPSHPPSSSKKGRPTTKRVARGELLAPGIMSDKTPAKSKKDKPSSSEKKTPATKTPSDKTSSSSSGQRSGRSSRRSATPSSSEKIYEIGADVNVLMDGKQYGGIVKNVDYGSDDSGSDKGAMYEVELSDGEIWDVNPRDMTEKEDEW